MNGKKQSGFVNVLVLAASIVVIAVGFSLWYVYQSNNSQNGSANSTVNNYGDCVAKGYLVQQTYPEVCKDPNGHSFTNPGSSSGDPNNTLSTLTGIVTISPKLPGPEQPGSESSAPLADHTVEAIDSKGQKIAFAKTDSNGKYVLHLNPGHYSLNISPKVGTGVIKGNEVDVVAGTNNHNIQADSGFR